MQNLMEEKIRDARLSKTEKRIADYFMEDPERLYFSTAKDIALALDVSDTSVIRLCRRLGYSGYRELQEQMRRELTDTIASERYVIPSEQLPEKAEELARTDASDHLALAVSALENTFRKNDPAKIDRAASLILDSDRVYVAGFRGAAGPAMYAGTMLSQFLPGVRTFSRADSGCIEAMTDCTDRDCLLVMSTPRYSRMAEILKDMALEAHSRIIVVTDRLTADLASGADEVLLCDPSGPLAVNSYLGMMFLLESILRSVSRQLGTAPSDRFQRIDRYLSQLGLY